MSHDQTPPRLIGSDGILAVSDVIATLGYYCDVLGFSDRWSWGQPPDFGGVRWGKVGVMFCLQPTLAAHIAGHQHAILVEGIDALHAMHERNGAAIISPLEAKPWGLREYIVRDLNGYHLRFGEPHTEHSPTAPVRPPISFAIADRKPTVAEFQNLRDAVGWKDLANCEVATLVLNNCLHGVVAMDGERVIGIGLIVGDGATFFYLKDIVVRPEHQGQGIGTAIVDALLAYIRRTAMHRAFVALFTPPSLANFYGRFGFLGPDERVNGMCLEVEPAREQLRTAPEGR
jgi:GNAT superfamily N-acetyltransferase